MAYMCGNDNYILCLSKWFLVYSRVELIEPPDFKKIGMSQ